MRPSEAGAVPIAIGRRATASLLMAGPRWWRSGPS
jgi:hypothetical protein